MLLQTNRVEVSESAFFSFFRLVNERCCS